MTQETFLLNDNVVTVHPFLPHRVAGQHRITCPNCRERPIERSQARQHDQNGQAQTNRSGGGGGGGAIRWDVEEGLEVGAAEEEGDEEEGAARAPGPGPVSPPTAAAVSGGARIPVVGAAARERREGRGVERRFTLI